MNSSEDARKSAGLPENVKKLIIPPESGWEEHTLYYVEVAFNRGNPIHKSLFFSGFLSRNGEPAQYSQLWNPSYEQTYKLSDIFYLKVLDKLEVKFRNGT